MCTGTFSPCAPRVCSFCCCLRALHVIYLPFCRVCGGEDAQLLSEATRSESDLCDRSSVLVSMPFCPNECLIAKSLSCSNIPILNGVCFARVVTWIWRRIVGSAPSVNRGTNSRLVIRECQLPICLRSCCRRLRRLSTLRRARR